MKTNNKSRLIPFLCGVLVMAVLMTGVLSLPALASTGSRTLTVSPINVLVNGEVFRPKDVNGNEVLVFVYNGTTYAPLRALAEAYGLEVNYDSARNMAIVNGSVKGEPSTLAPAAPFSTVSYEEFASQWTVKEKPVTNYGSEKIFTVKYSGPLSMADFKTWWKTISADTIKTYAERLAAETQCDFAPGYEVTAYFTFGQYNLGTAFAMGGYQFSNFDAAGVWIK